MSARPPLTTNGSLAESIADPFPGAYPATPASERPATLNRNESSLGSMPEERLSVPVAEHSTQTTPTIEPAEESDGRSTPGYPGYFGAMPTASHDSGGDRTPTGNAEHLSEPRKDYGSADTKFPLLFPSPLLDHSPVQPIGAHLQDFPKDASQERSNATTPAPANGQGEDHCAWAANSQPDMVGGHSHSPDLPTQNHSDVGQRDVSGISGATTPTQDNREVPVEQNNRQSVPHHYLLAMKADSQSTVGSNPEIHDGVVTHHPERIIYSGIDVPPLPDHQSAGGLETPHREEAESTYSQDRETLRGGNSPAIFAAGVPLPASRQQSARNVNESQPFQSDRPSVEHERSINEQRPDAQRLNSLQRQELAMIPTAGAYGLPYGNSAVPQGNPVYSQGDAQYGHVDSKQPVLVSQQAQPGGFIHPWDRRHPSNLTPGQNDQKPRDYMMAAVPVAAAGVPIAAAMHPRADEHQQQNVPQASYGHQQQAAPQAAFMNVHHPQPVHYAQPQFPGMDRAGSQTGSVQEHRRAGIFDSMAGVPDPTYEYQNAPPQRMSVIETPSRARTPAHFYDQDQENVGRAKSVRSTRTANTARDNGPLLRGDRGNRPATLKRRHTLPDNPLFVPKSAPARKKKSGFFSWFHLPDNPLYASKPKHHRLPESPLLANRSKSTRSRRSYSEGATAPSRRYSQATTSTRRQSKLVPDSPWTPGGSSKRNSTIKRRDEERVAPHQRTTSIMSRNLSQRRRSMMSPSQGTIVRHEQGEAVAGEEVPLERANTLKSARASTAGIESRPRSTVGSPMVAAAPVEKPASIMPDQGAKTYSESRPLSAMGNNQSRPLSAAGQQVRPVSILKSPSRTPSRAATAVESQEMQPTYSYVGAHEGQQSDVRQRVLREEGGYNSGF